MAFDFVARNQESRNRLQQLAARLKDEDFARSVGDGWTVLTVFAHLAFWDRRVLVILERWEKDGFSPSPYDSASINEAAFPFWQAMPPREAVRLAIISAEATDKKLESLPAALVEQIIADETSVRVQRAVHRNNHMDQIERALA